MAQYGHNWYGTSYYGETNAFSGWYQTKELFTEQPLKDTVTTNMRVTLPSASYGPTDPEVFKQAGTWTYDSTNKKLYSGNANAQLVLTATADQIVIQYEQRTVAALVHISVETTLPGQAPTTTTYDLNTQSSTVNSNATYTISGLAFGLQKVTITIDSANTTSGSYFNFKGFMARTANLTVESRARLGSAAWPTPYADAAYTKLTTTITPVSGSTTDYIVSGVSPNYAGKDHIQFKVYLASSDNETTPEIQYVEVVAGNSNNRTKNGEWTATFNMLNIASQAGVSFASVDEVTWTENVPATTTLTVRSQSLTPQGFKDYVTAPYKQGVNRIRLRSGHNNGWIDTPLSAPAKNVPYVTTTNWLSWKEQSYFPPDSAGADIVYDFLNTTKDNYLAPYYKAGKVAGFTSSLNGVGTLKNNDTVVRITLSRTDQKQTPVVDLISLVSQMHYQQDHIIEGKDFSAVDNHNTGKDVVLDMSTISNTWVVPHATSSPSYKLIDNTKRPTDIVLYYDSEKSAASRKNVTTNIIDKVWAETKAYNSKTTKGLAKGYQYGGGQVSYPLTEEIQMVNNFTMENKKAMDTSLHYRYHLDAGWPQEYYTTLKGDTLAQIAEIYSMTPADFSSINTKLLYDKDGTLLANQNLKIPNDSVNSNINLFFKSTNSDITSKSATNALLDGLSNVESDSISATVKQNSIYGLVDWVSEEKIYDGIINLNGVAGDYKRVHPANTLASDGNIKYTAVTGDTYASISDVYNVYEDDVRWLNGAVNGEEPTVGQVVLVPPPFSLPWIDPQAIIADNPYNVIVVFNSVKKDDGTLLAENIINSAPLAVTYEEIESTAQITRGAIANGKDLLPSPMVTSITSVETDMVTYNEWNTTLNIGDFKLTDNNIDWSPATNAAEPTAGTVYTVTYKHNVPKDVTVDFSTLYYEEGGVDRIWRSSEVKQFTGMCYPGNDYVADLPDFNSWQGLPDNNVEDLAYIIEDNDLWVKTWAEQRNGKWVVVGSLQDRVPKDNWFPTIKTGYYYLGQDEYYMFSEPITLSPGEEEVPTAKNVQFVPAKFDNGARVQEASQNLILNSGFDVTNTTSTVFKLTF
jgi:hypothetical protein